MRLFSLNFGGGFQPLLDRKGHIFKREKRGQQGGKRKQRTPCWNLTHGHCWGVGIRSTGELLEHLLIVYFTVLKYFWSPYNLRRFQTFLVVFKEHATFQASETACCILLQASVLFRRQKTPCFSPVFGCSNERKASVKQQSIKFHRWEVQYFTVEGVWLD